jgi:hypothetical protein
VHKAKAFPITFLDGQASSNLEVQSHCQKAATHAPYFDVADEALGQQGATGIKFRVPAALDQHNACVVYAINLTALTETKGLDIDAMNCIAHDRPLISLAPSESGVELASPVSPAKDLCSNARDFRYLRGDASTQFFRHLGVTACVTPLLRRYMVTREHSAGDANETGIVTPQSLDCEGMRRR